ncbi:2-phosphosulfolactate phosphatase [Alteribacillus sp. JSM 102045]|uniref:2-phosphosulfolactate phosphatase n=1 Tax=Alteribacillus sp. JSM 102045 TaxID=1562101 RepID=UPI0035C2179E
MKQKIHVIMKKEDIIPERLDGKQAVVFDVLLATTVITSFFAGGAAAIYPVLDAKEGFEVNEREKPKHPLLVGEKKGLPIEGFQPPSPSVLKKEAADKHIILSTTNGTVALRKAEAAKVIYASSLLNNYFVAKELLSNKNAHDDITIICAGSAGQFCLEDYYGAGHLISHLININQEIELSDAVIGAWKLVQGQPDTISLLQETAVGKMLKRHGYEKDVAYAANKDIYPVLPIMQKNGWMRNKGGVLSG